MSRSISFHRLFFVGALALVLFRAPSFAQAPPPPATQPAGDSDLLDPSATLPQRQSVLKHRVARLEDRMFQLSQALRNAEPDKAAQLLQSLGAARGMQLQPQIDAIIKRLRDQNYADAIDQQKQVSADLQQLLKLLLEGPDELDKLDKDIERLAELRKNLSEIIKKQKAHRDKALAAAGKPRQALAELAARAKKLLEDQRALSAQSGSVNPDFDDLADRQAALGDQTRALAEDLGDDSAAPADARQALSAAADAMNAAQSALSQAQPRDAAVPQQDAEKKLAEALDALNQQIQSNDPKPPAPLDKQADAQRATAEQTRALGSKMGAPPESSDGGQSPSSKGGNGKQSSGKKEPSGQNKKQDGGQDQDESSAPQEPGAEEVQEAVPFQEEAADKLDEQKPDAAAKDQQRAIEKLQQARKAVDDELEQKRAEQRQELLAALESRFRAMLARQLECNKAAKKLDDLGRENWKRSQQLEIAELSPRQAWIADEADQALTILKEEGTTVVFPQVVEHVRDDARDVAAAIAKSDCGPDVQVVQESIADTLRELIEAIVQKQSEESENSPSPSPDGDSNPPLLPGSAELKLLRSCQLRVNKLTRRLDEQRPSRPETLAPDLAERLNRLSRRQDQVYEMAKAMHESMTKAQ